MARQGLCLDTFSLVRCRAMTAMSVETEGSRLQITYANRSTELATSGEPKLYWHW